MKRNRWDIWLAKVKFENIPGCKTRPVLIYDDTQYYIHAFKMTSSNPRDNCWGEYRIQQFQSAGLDRKTTVRLSKKLELYDGDFITKIGRLSPIDIVNVKKLILDDI